MSAHYLTFEPEKRTLKPPTFDRQELTLIDGRPSLLRPKKITGALKIAYTHAVKSKETGKSARGAH